MIPTKRRRRILEKLKIDEISGVDRPAQEGAVVTIMKRSREQEPTMTKLNDLEDSILILRDRVDVLNKNLTDRAQPAPPPIPDFDEVVSAIRKRDGCGGTAAMSKARREAPDAFAIYNRLVPKKPAKEPHDDDFEDLVEASKEKYYGARSNADRVSKSANATADFMREVDAVAITKNLSRTAAMSEARRREPELYERFQEG